MINNHSSNRNRFIDGILIVVAIGMLAASIYSVYLAWTTGLAQSRAQTASRLMAIRTSPRSTETPGINAWVSWSLLNSKPSDSVEDDERLRLLVSPRTGSQFPEEFRGVLNALRQPLPESPNPIAFKTDSDIGGQAKTQNLEFRSVNYVQNQSQLFVLSARSDPSLEMDRSDFSGYASTHLLSIEAALNKQPELVELKPLNRIRSARIARIYVLNEDESLVSLPFANPHSAKTDREDFSLFLSEGDEFRKNALSPTLVSNTFFFNFQYDKPLLEQAAFSGMYLDLGGLGLVASVTTPVVYNGKRAVLGADIAFDIDWEEFARNLSPNLVSHVAHTGSDAKAWNPWNEFLKDFPANKPNLQSALQSLVQRDSLESDRLSRKSIYLERTEDGGDLMAIQVNRSTWLLLLVAANEVQLPWTTILLTSVVFLSLLFRIEQSRRVAVAAQASAAGEMQEKQNLLDTMQVPLMVVDPNTDQLVYCNRAAQSIGMTQGDFFGQDVVAQDERSQSHYRETQTLGEAHRRAYGVPIRIHRNRLNSKVSATTLPDVQSSKSDNADSQYAIVRSVAVTAPIDSLHADERHRLGILFLVNEHRDLGLLMNKRIAETRIDEKRQLSGLMNHGVDSLARILRNQLQPKEGGSIDPSDFFAHWLSVYLSDRIQLMAWTLENWGQTPSRTERRLIDCKTVRATLERQNQIFQTVANDRALREQLHWNNGVVSGRAADPKGPPILRERIEWSDESFFAVPREGVFGFFLGEALINAVRHGKPNSIVEVTIEENPIRNEIQFRIENETTDIPVRSIDGDTKPYGGITILRELARLSGWGIPEVSHERNQFALSWSVPAIRPNMNRDGD